jgi:hypothetical protein
VRNNGRTRITQFAGTAAAWQRNPKGRPMGSAILAASGEVAAVVVWRSGHNTLKFYDLATGKRVDHVGVGARDIVDVEPYRADAIAALTVGYATPKSRVVVRSLAGGRSVVVFRGLVGIDLAVGEDGPAVLGRTGEGNGRVELRSEAGSLLAAIDLDPATEPMGIVTIDGGFLIAVRDGTDLVVLRTDDRLVVTGSITIPNTGAAAIGPANFGFVVARRELSTGTVVVELRDPDGAVVQSAGLPGSFDPVALSAGDLVGIALQRFGDGAAMITIYDGKGSPKVSSRSLP